MTIDEQKDTSVRRFFIILGLFFAAHAVMYIAKWLGFYRHDVEVGVNVLAGIFGVFTVIELMILSTVLDAMEEIRKYVNDNFDRKATR